MRIPLMAAVLCTVCSMRWYFLFYCWKTVRRRVSIAAAATYVYLSPRVSPHGKQPNTAGGESLGTPAGPEASAHRNPIPILSYLRL